MKAAGNLPSSDLLAPSDVDKSALVKVPPPAYATKPGFAFNLRCLMMNHVNIYVRIDQPFNLQELQDNSSLETHMLPLWSTVFRVRSGSYRVHLEQEKATRELPLSKCCRQTRTRARQTLNPWETVDVMDEWQTLDIGQTKTAGQILDPSSV